MTLIPDDSNPTPAAKAKRDPITCEFCDSLLSRRGEVLKMSERARALRLLEDRIAKMESDMAARDGEVTRLTAELTAVRAELEQAKRGDGASDTDDDDDLL